MADPTRNPDQSQATGQEQQQAVDQRQSAEAGRSGGPWAYRLWPVLIRLYATLDRPTLAWLAALAVLHGLIYVVIAPPWQHYDEPGHFEYAAAIARSGIPFDPPVDLATNREIADSMYRFRFWKPGERPDLLGPLPPPLGVDQRVHPPLYYSLAALPIRMFQGLSIELQLYAARLFSVVLYTLTVLAAWRVAVLAAPDEPLAQLCLPLLVACHAPFSDLMSAVNSDVLVNFSMTTMFLGCGLLLRDGPRPAGLALAGLGLLVGLLAKRTAVAAIIPFTLAVIWAFQRERVRIGFWAIGAGLLLLAAVAALRIEVGDQGLTLHARAWFVTLDETYLRLNIDQWLVSISDWQRSRQAYDAALRLLFRTYWLVFAWAHVVPAPFWNWLIGIMLVLCGLGLLRGLFIQHSELPLWQRRLVWLFFIAVVAATVSALLRVHPLPPEGLPRFLTGGRYAFFVLLPLAWLLALGWQLLMPAAWRPYSLPVLVGFFVVYDLSVWSGTLVDYYYRQAAL